MNRTAVYAYSQASKHLGYNNIGQTITIDDENAFCPSSGEVPLNTNTPPTLKLESSSRFHAKEKTQSHIIIIDHQSRDSSMYTIIY
ncbi:unnamed protein product [Alternaria burnsii]|nr:unnamed protein product [Alternaria burnsii]